MQCLMTYKWVKLLRSHLPEGKGLMAYWAKLASHAAFRKGQALYCGHYNRVAPGMWSGGMVGLKRILGLIDDDNFPAIDVVLLSKNEEEKVCFVEFNPERERGRELCIGVYCRDSDETTYYESYNDRKE